MNYDIYKYIDGQMSDREKSEFEKLLQTDLKLKADFEQASKKLGAFSDSAKNIQADETYFNNVTVNFRTKLESKKTPRLLLLPKYSFALPVAILMVMMSVLFLNTPTHNNMNLTQIINEYDDSSKSELINEYAENTEVVEEAIETTDSQVGELIQTTIATELSTDTEAVSKDMQLSYSDLNQVIDNLSEKEQNDIYNEMINKKIL